MTFLNPSLLWLAPLVALPILIHFLNRLRYRRVQWAAIDFLLATERRAVRRSRFRHLLLMALRVLLLGAALGAALEPVVGGAAARLLSASSQAVVLLDGSASMAAADLEGAAFDEGLERIRGIADDLPSGARLHVAVFGRDVPEAPRRPLLDQAAAVEGAAAAGRTDGRGDVPAALVHAAESLQAGGGGGLVWIVTDGQAADWRAGDAGAWEAARRALRAAGDPRILVTDILADRAPRSNVRVESVRLDPPLLRPGDMPRLTAVVRADGSGPVEVRLALRVGDRGLETRTLSIDAPGTAEAAFALPAIEEETVAAILEISPDAMPADDRFHILLGPAPPLKVLVATDEGVDAPGAFLVESALAPAGRTFEHRSPFVPVRIDLAELARADLSGSAAIVLPAGPPADRAAEERLHAFVRAGGVLVIFPGDPGRIAEPPLRLAWASPTHPATAGFSGEWLDRVRIARVSPLEPAETAEPILLAEGDRPIVVAQTLGRGRILQFAVRADLTASNLGRTPLLVLLLHQALGAHLGGSAVGHAAGEPLALAAPPEGGRILDPAGAPVAVESGRGGGAVVSRPNRAGVYRTPSGEPVGALNVPAEESSVERIAPARIEALLDEFSVSFFSAEGEAGEAAGGDGPRRGSVGFLFALLAAAFLASETVLGRRLSRPAPAAGHPGEAAR